MAAVSEASDRVARFEEQLNRAADEVFSTMMGVSCSPVEPVAAPDRESISAVIGLAGALSGALVLYAGRRAAMRMAEHLTGMAPEGLDPTVRDAVGEVCNMVAGAWKSQDPRLISGCLLSTPTVVAGSSYELFSLRAPLRIERTYQFEAHTLILTLYCEGLF